MKKIAVFFLAIMFILTGCSSGISQADYDAVVAERDEALAQIDLYRNYYDQEVKMSDAVSNISHSIALIKALEELKKIESKSIDMVFADPPYFLSGAPAPIKSNNPPPISATNCKALHVDTTDGYILGISSFTEALYQS